MCLAQGPQRSDSGEGRSRGPSVKHSTIEPLLSLSLKILGQGLIVVTLKIKIKQLGGKTDIAGSI